MKAKTLIYLVLTQALSGAYSASVNVNGVEPELNKTMWKLQNSNFLAKRTQTSVGDANGYASGNDSGATNTPTKTLSSTKEIFDVIGQLYGAKEKKRLHEASLFKLIHSNDANQDTQQKTEKENRLKDEIRREDDRIAEYQQKFAGMYSIPNAEPGTLTELLRLKSLNDVLNDLSQISTYLNEELELECGCNSKTRQKAFVEPIEKNLEMTHRMAQFFTLQTRITGFNNQFLIECTEYLYTPTDNSPTIYPEDENRGNDRVELRKRNNQTIDIQTPRDVYLKIKGNGLLQDVLLRKYSELYILRNRKSQQADNMDTDRINDLSEDFESLKQEYNDVYNRIHKNPLWKGNNTELIDSFTRYLRLHSLIDSLKNIKLYLADELGVECECELDGRRDKMLKYINSNLDMAQETEKKFTPAILELIKETERSA
ncbi:hypothetical protein AX774_g128 [Zancudomyces culisetae]|uniref:Uncharacterized protein n=1 Tax=Zancudomyces culisetae TaxID=1213189 RepID=A0A1R1PZ73_ZANCU|nr:hypothetical protein AX774_g128 [Zancudomyces culisetae]|eukprot:OMH86237.1 hypothetical protein AX774_g128 [Zancudomyces culisetae]